MYIGVFGGGQVARFISYQYFLRHPQPPKQSKEEIELLVATVMIQAREARARERILGSGAVTSTPYG
jgi:hypothetical protein